MSENTILEIREHVLRLDIEKIINEHIEAKGVVSRDHLIKTFSQDLHSYTNIEIDYLIDKIENSTRIYLSSLNGKVYYRRSSEVKKTFEEV